MFVILTNDLMIQSSASAAARSQGATMVGVSSMDSAIDKIESGTAFALFINLQTPGLVLDELVARLVQLPKRPTVVAFAQHVEDELLALAKTAVFDQVLTRGQFSRLLPQLIADNMPAPPAI